MGGKGSGGTIKDEFSRMAISRQRRYQLRKHRDKKCVDCGQKAVTKFRCLKHAVAQREHQRRYNSLTYRLQAKASKNGRNGRHK